MLTSGEWVRNAYITCLELEDSSTKVELILHNTIESPDLMVKVSMV